MLYSSQLNASFMGGAKEEKEPMPFDTQEQTKALKLRRKEEEEER